MAPTKPQVATAAAKRKEAGDAHPYVFSHLFSSDTITDDVQRCIYSGEATKRAKKAEGGLRTNWQKHVANAGMPTSAHRAATTGPPLAQPSSTTATPGPVISSSSPFDTQSAGPAPQATAGSAKSARNARQVCVLILCILV